MAPSRVININVGIRVVSKQMKNESILREEKVKIKKSIIINTRIRNFFCMLLFLFFIFLFAKKHSGASQQLRMIRGVDSLSVPNLSLSLTHVFVLLLNRFIAMRVIIENEQNNLVHFHRFNMIGMVEDRAIIIRVNIYLSMRG